MSPFRMTYFIDKRALNCDRDSNGANMLFPSTSPLRVCQPEPIDNVSSCGMSESFAGESTFDLICFGSADC